MECKNCGNETKIRVDDGIGSHVEEDDTCMACRGWMISDYTNIYNAGDSKFSSWLGSVGAVKLPSAPVVILRKDESDGE